MLQFFSSRRVLFSMVLPIIAIGACVLLFYGTPQGLGLNDDSIAYIGGARSLLSGQGYREVWLVSAGLMTHFPPGFPGSLALVSILTGLDPLRSARLLNGLLFGLNTLLMGWLALRMTGSRLLGVFASLLFVLTPSMLRIHSNAMSEPLYIFFTLLAFLLLDFYFQRHIDRPSWVLLAAAGCLIGFAYLTRYAALALLATAAMALLIMHDSWRRRTVAIGILLAGFLPWMAGWAVRNRLVGGSLTNRALGWHPVTYENARMGLRTFSGFVVPVDIWQLALLKIHALFEILLVLLGLILLVWVLNIALKRFFRGSVSQQVEPISLLNGLYVFGYFLALLATMILFDPATKFQLRIVAPIFVSLLLLLIYWLGYLAGKSYGRKAALILAAVILGISAFGQGRNLADLRRGGQVYANERWFDAPAIAALRDLPANVAIHSNQPGVVYLYVGRPGALLPDNPAGISQLQEQVRTGQAVIAIFRSPGEDENTLAYYDLIGNGLPFVKYKGDIIYSAP